MKSNFRFVDKCRLCESTDLNVVFSLQPSPLGDRYLPIGSEIEPTNLIPFEINHCGRCNNFQTSTATDPDHYKHCLTRPASVNKSLRAAYEDSAMKLIELACLKPANLVLELGSNDGLFGSFFC